MTRWWPEACVALAALSVACPGASADLDGQATSEEAAVEPSPGAVSPDERRQARAPSSIAPPSTLEGATLAGATTEPLTLTIGDDTWGSAWRVDAAAGEHIGFHLVVEPPRARVDLQVLAWIDGEPTSMGLTNWGPGLRVLAARDPRRPRTFWVRARGSIPQGHLTITRTPFDDGPICRSDCDRLLQLPLPLDENTQGYRIAEGSVYAYQFGRRDLLMALFNAGRKVSDAGIPPFAVKRLSRWDGGRPPCHRSHINGIDVDVSLYRSSGETVWYPLCTDQGGRRCVRGTSWEFGAAQTATLISGFLESGLFDGEGAIFVDREFHRELRRAADSLLDQGVITEDIRALFRPRSHLLQHVEPHHHHLHIRVEERGRRQPSPGPATEVIDAAFPAR